MSDHIEVTSVQSSSELLDRMCDGVQFHVTEAALASEAGLDGFRKLHEGGAIEECRALVDALCASKGARQLSMSRYVPEHGTSPEEMLTAYQKWEAGTLLSAMESSDVFACKVIDNVCSELELIRKLRSMSQDDVDRWLQSKL